MNDLPTTRAYKNMLFDFYGALLTEKQRDIYTMHHDDDCSLAEIGNTLGVTPQAVADMLKRADGKLNRYEEKLGLVQKHRDQQTCAADIAIMLDKLEDKYTAQTLRTAIDKMML